MSWLGRMALLFALLVGAMQACASDAQPLAADEAIEQRLNRIADELRCLVCQNESLAGSRADLAVDLRREIRELIKTGKSDSEIVEFMVSRYGDFVRYRPPFKPSTWLLWLAPFLLMLAGVGGLLWHLRRRRQVQAPLSDDEQARAARLLAGE